MTKEGNDYIANGLTKQSMPEYKAVGGIYQCENCSSDYTAKTTWQKYCPVCSAERKAGVLKTRYKKGTHHA